MISLYIIIENNLPDAALDRAANWLAVNKPLYTTVMSGGQIDRAQRFAERILPYTRVIFRVFPNDGVLKTFDYNADKYYDARVAPYERWLRDHSIIWHVDNESAEDDLTPYADCTARIIRIAVDNHVMTAVGAFATGNPRENQYVQLDPMWRALDEHRDMAIWAPHEYHAQTAALSGGHINRYMLAWARCDQLGIARPITVIGEYGYLHSKDGRLDPEWGFRRDAIAGNVAAGDDMSYHRQWYAQNGVTACVYAFGGTSGKWAALNVDDNSYLNTMTAYNATLRLPPQTPPIPDPPTPPPAVTTPGSLPDALRDVELTIGKLEALAPVFRKAADDMQVAILSAQLAKDEIEKLMKGQK